MGINNLDGVMNLLMQRTVDDDKVSPRLLNVHKINHMFYVASAIATGVWILLLILVYGVLPHEREDLPQTESDAAKIALAMLVISNLLIVMPFALRGRRGTRSGIMLAALVTQFIAITTNLILAFAPNLVLVDPVTHARVFLTRWTEWIPLAGLMTFFSEAVDLPKSKPKQRWPIWASVCQSLSCFFGALLPLCPTMFWWNTALFLSVITFLPIFPRILLKRKAYILASKGDNFLELEQYDRIRFSYYLILTCGCIWSVLVVAYFVNFALHRFLSVSHWLRAYPLAMIVDAAFDVLAKAIYMKLIVDVHFLVFDSEGRTQRQLTELRSLLNVLWDSSSDVIIISVRYADKITSMMSPSYPKLVGATLPATLKGRRTTALMLETDISRVEEAVKNGECTQNPISASYVDSSEMPYGRVARKTVLHHLKPTDPEVVKAVGFVGAAWSRFTKHDNGDSSLVMFPLQRIGGSKHKCEIKVSYHTSNSIIAVVRDVTERYRRFEAERRAHSEALARQRDAQSQTRFVRHEVKNGLLSGIELCDSLRNAMDEMRNRLRASETNHRRERSDLSCDDSSSELDGAQSITSRTPLTDLATRHLEDLDRTLHEVLDTVLAETMARDVIHEVYHPRLEHLDVKGYLANSTHGENVPTRFPVEIEDGGNLPYLQLDPQLMRYIHRNAISNACKYGKTGGQVITKLAYHPQQAIFEMKVVNEPGAGHDELINMGEKATKAVFEQGTRLHPHLKVDDRYISSGDGAWIVQKCAATMGGTCGISFEPNQTVFSFRCPAQPLHVANLPKTHDFEVPSDTWGIVIDDSKIQRKLMARILTHAGVEEERRIVLGESPTDIVELGEIMQRLLRDHPQSKILCLVDENLDYDDKGAEHVVLSGSIAMKNILQRLTPSEENRLLVLVRSANDSADDVALYLSRTHGFFPKTTMQRDRVKEILAPLWAERFLTGNPMQLSRCSRTSSMTDEDFTAGSDEGSGPLILGSQ